MNIEWTFRDADDGEICATAHITTSDGSWAIVRQRGHIIGFTSYGDVGQEIVEAAVEILRRYTETGKIWAQEPAPAPEMDLPCMHCGRPVRVKDDSLDGACEDMFAAGL